MTKYHASWNSFATFHQEFIKNSYKLIVRGGLTYTCTGLGIPGATITFTGTGQFTSGQSTVTDAIGRYDTTFEGGSSPGTYTLQTHFAGQDALEPSDPQTQTYDCRLRPPPTGPLRCD